ncbi:MAG: phosphoadenylyl-sulfate reductase [Bacteroidales bacterium]|nr:phosphoadenylyl-sulfate reductase [Bacteroidales bacterium]MCF6341725.1 phosphoadenylyl-sulfate reductase [Bacteroidales bacterium]
MIDPKTIESWNGLFENQSPETVLRFFLHHFEGRIALASSMGPEDQVLTQMTTAVDPKTEIFTLDTGRLFQETYDLIDRTSKKYKTRIRVLFPETKEVEEMVSSKGINLFFDSVGNRKLCCSVRKLKPLARALEGFDAWITGLRKEQSVTRNHLNIVEWDDANGLLKINPLINWTEQGVWDYIELKNIPYSPLHQKGFSSIGCQPCTRAIEKEEDVRAGRWWWENPETKECGLHQK